jgi:hypothetical protein
MSKGRWKWAETVAGLTEVQRTKEGFKRRRNSSGRFINLYGVTAIGRAAKAKPEARFAKVMCEHLHLSTAESDTGQRRVVTNSDLADYCGMLYAAARKIAHKGRPKRALKVIVEELHAAVEDLPPDKRGNRDAEQAVIDDIQVRYLKRR